MTAAIIIVLHLKMWVHLPVPTASLHGCILHWVAQRKYTNPILYIMELVIGPSRYKFQPHPLPFTTFEYSKCRFYRCSKWPFNDRLGMGGRCHSIWHPRKFGTPVPYILRYFAPPWDIWHPLWVRNYGTPIPNILGIMVPPYQIS